MSYPGRLAPSPEPIVGPVRGHGCGRPTPSRTSVGTSKEVGDVDQLKESKYVANVFRLLCARIVARANY
jgi:hypothetical protein